jgi:hypothetical protein
MTGLIAGDTALRWFVYLLVLTLGAWGVAMLAWIGVAVRRRAQRRDGTQVRQSGGVTS